MGQVCPRTNERRFSRHRTNPTFDRGRQLLHRRARNSFFQRGVCGSSRALTSLYAAAAAFALATVTAILGAVPAALSGGNTLKIGGAAAILLGVLGFAWFIASAIGLGLEGRLAVRAIKEETDEALTRITRGI